MELEAFKIKVVPLRAKLLGLSLSEAEDYIHLFISGEQKRPEMQIV